MSKSNDKCIGESIGNILFTKSDSRSINNNFLMKYPAYINLILVQTN